MKYGLAEHGLRNLAWFQTYWRMGVPGIPYSYFFIYTHTNLKKLVVITACNENLKLKWTPEEFMEKCGVEKHDMIDCRDGTRVDQLTVADFFAGYLAYDKRPMDKTAKMRLKLKDYPAGEDFSTKLPEHFTDLMQALPYSEYVRPDGILNLISALPAEYNKPDLGPKCYIAYEDTSTSLHFDMSDAVNLLVHIGPLSSALSSPTNSKSTPTKPPFLNHSTSIKQSPSRVEAHSKAGALWHIFRREDVTTLATFLKSRAKGKGDREEDHTILDHSFYIDEQMLGKLAEEYKVVPHTIYQEEGDAVFIPAGCPHQVKNIRCCIKVAEDFVSPENLEHCIKLTDEFRKLPPSHKFRTDRLGVRTILYHAMEKAVKTLIP